MIYDVLKSKVNHMQSLRNPEKIFGPQTDTSIDSTHIDARVPGAHALGTKLLMGTKLFKFLSKFPLKDK